MLCRSVEGSYHWKQIEATGEAPSYLCNHTAVVMENQMLVYGGRISTMLSSNVLYALNLDTYNWRIV
jgi:hypothetical protein